MPRNSADGAATARVSGAMPSGPAAPHETGQATQSGPIGLEPGIGPCPTDAQISGAVAVITMVNPASTACNATA